MKASVFDEDFAGMPPPDDHPCQVDSRHIALQRVRIQRWSSAFGVELHTQTLDERKIRVVAGQGEHMFCRKPLSLPMLLNHYFVLGELLNAGIKERLDLACLDAVFDVRANPILEGSTQFFSTMHQCDSRSIPVEIERGF